MLPSTSIAFKEWSVICAALGAGRQSIIVRKGGIDEGREGIRIAHGEFWLFPTLFHEAAEKLTADARPFLELTECEVRPTGMIPLSHYASVSDVVELRDEALLPRLDGLHVWSPRTIGERFHYRRPGLFVLIVRTYSLTPPLLIPDSPHFAGCRTWVELPAPLETAGLQPILSDAEFHAAREQVVRALAPHLMA
jgi:hypothetical protein